MHVLHEDMATRLFSPRVWKGFAPPNAFTPHGSVATGESGNRAFGFFDDFLTFTETTLDGPYAILKGTGCTQSKVADTAAAKGILSMTLDGNADNDECVLKWGSTLSAPFYLANNDLAFECCLAISSIAASKHDIAVAISAAGKYRVRLSGMKEGDFSSFVDDVSVGW